MDIKECYAKMNADYDVVVSRFGSEAMAEKFAVRFLDDPSFEELCSGMDGNDGEKAFRAAHTLKGVCANLGFSALYNAAAALTEKLRERNTEGSEELFKKVKKQYEITAAALREFESGGAEF